MNINYNNIIRLEAISKNAGRLNECADNLRCAADKMTSADQSLSSSRFVFKNENGNISDKVKQDLSEFSIKLNDLSNSLDSLAQSIVSEAQGVYNNQYAIEKARVDSYNRKLEKSKDND